MGTEKLTQEEANNLLEMVKRSLVSAINFPSRGKAKEFDVIGKTKKDVFSISIYRAKIQPCKYNLGGQDQEKWYYAARAPRMSIRCSS